MKLCILYYSVHLWQQGFCLLNNIGWNIQSTQLDVSRELFDSPNSSVYLSFHFFFCSFLNRTFTKVIFKQKNNIFINNFDGFSFMKKKTQSKFILRLMINSFRIFGNVNPIIFFLQLFRIELYCSTLL